jgi:hypothetical protein
MTERESHGLNFESGMLQSWNKAGPGPSCHSFCSRLVLIFFIVVFSFTVLLHSRLRRGLGRSARKQRLSRPLLSFLRSSAFPARIETILIDLGISVYRKLEGTGLVSGLWGILDDQVGVASF